jgi:hypothetical protein
LVGTSVNPLREDEVCPPSSRHGIRVLGLRLQGMLETGTIDQTRQRASRQGLGNDLGTVAGVLASRPHPLRLMTLEEMAYVAVFMASEALPQPARPLRPTSEAMRVRCLLRAGEAG